MTDKTIYVVSICDKYEGGAEVIYAGASKQEAENKVDLHMRGDAVVKWQEWLDGVQEIEKVGTPQLEWNTQND